MAVEGKTEKRKSFRHGKCHKKGQQAAQDQSMTMEKSWVMMMKD